MENKEYWKIIRGFPDYLISNKGRVKTIKTLKDRTLHINTGYKVVVFDVNGKRYLRLVHRIVATEFIDNPLNKPCINHNNGVKTDNRVENLEWCTHKENIAHAIKIGLIPKKEKKKKITSRKYKETDKEVKDMIQEKYQKYLDDLSEIKTMKRKHGEDVNGSKLTPLEVIEIRVYYYYKVYKQKELAEKYNISASTVSEVITRKRWGHID